MYNASKTELDISYLCKSMVFVHAPYTQGWRAVLLIGGRGLWQATTFHITMRASLMSHSAFCLLI